ncbi:sugar phosphate nucleotidyltransferase [Anaeromassilibacillus sp. SJQ-1]|uniref:sugar phosphate nucleotidyltransferase n=1 Tax=Anaeromassilibacillus sp. SJQ-1 TaxID=3375419 RepID=UPI00398919E9
MMRGNNILGILFANVHEEKIRELTEKRTMGSVPFGGRYRLIDFPLSNLVNSGINKVGVVTKGNYQSLMDHLGSGKAWDLSRRELRPVYASAVWPRIPGQQQSD